jgi:hypothetical protein
MDAQVKNPVAPHVPPFPHDSPPVDPAKYNPPKDKPKGPGHGTPPPMKVPKLPRG